jgi:hypothetical protein
MCDNVVGVLLNVQLWGGTILKSARCGVVTVGCDCSCAGQRLVQGVDASPAGLAHVEIVPGSSARAQGVLYCMCVPARGPVCPRAPPATHGVPIIVAPDVCVPLCKSMIVVRRGLVGSMSGPCRFTHRSGSRMLSAAPIGCRRWCRTPRREA